MPQIWCGSNYYLQSYGILEKNGTRHFSLIGRHLENVSQTEPAFDHNLAPSEKGPTYDEFRSDSGIFDRVATFVPGQSGQRS